MNLRELKQRLLAWSNEKACLSNEPISSSSLNLFRFYGEDELGLEAGTGVDQIAGLFDIVHRQDTAFADVLRQGINPEDLLGIAYFLSRYKGSVREYTLNKLCLQYPAINDHRQEIAQIIEAPKDHWPSCDPRTGRFLYRAS